MPISCSLAKQELAWSSRAAKVGMLVLSILVLFFCVRFPRWMLCSIAASTTRIPPSSTTRRKS